VTPAATVGRDERLRLFLALQLPDGVLDALVRWQERCLRGGRVVPRAQLHVTLAFLGARPAGELQAIVAALRDACRGAAPVRLEPVSWHETRSVGMVVLRDDHGGATALAHDLHDRLAALGAYRPERRRWLAHVTTLRFRERPWLDPPLPETGTFVPSGAAAYLSRLHPSGARYEVLERVSLIEGG
jgi:RNA 2',3'-cyclic 3'-phosphodiesterase